MTDRNLEALRRAFDQGKVLIIAGAGTSIGLTSAPKAMSWVDLILNGLAYSRERGLLNDAQFARLSDALTSDDMDDLLSSAEFLTRKLGDAGSDIYARWLESAVGHLSPSANSLRDALVACKSRQIPIATLNYDTVLEEVLAIPSFEISDIRLSTAWLRREEEGVLHLHGVWTKPSTCVLGIRDYQRTIEHEVRQFIQRAIAGFNCILFIGCGDTFGDPNFNSLIKWMRTNVGPAMPQHYALVRQDDLPEKLANPMWQGFVEPVSFGKSFSDLGPFLRELIGDEDGVRATKRRLRKQVTNSNPAIDAYREFIVRDCGQMTIEGIRADMETAKQRFDIERLFVPLEVDPVPPEHLLNTPDKEDELATWRERNPSQVSFGKAFSKKKRMALLALPGGGKTLLLKRVAVAYADKNRQDIVADELPKLDLLPVMIRCREWKDYTRLPIPVLFDSLFEITGDKRLEGFGEQVTPLLKSGKVILLVDGLDEIHDDASRSIFVENLEKFLDIYPKKKIRLLVTSREAGFGLVAPCLARFCEKWKISPLSEQSIRLLSRHWHELMLSRNAEASIEAEIVADMLLGLPSLKRLAENPLLLTMLLVVKHGAGRLPPDRVSLYSRATEVLLDTWNIKGHDALNVRESVPQLACLAYELLLRGQQTATQREMVEILEEARIRLPQIARYAKDEPLMFLKRVELRSSLLVEAGYMKDGIETVPFYQFRHLTFQEYLAAVAITDGHYFSYKKDDSVLSPLSDVMLADEWKEVVPMVAVLARKQAAPLLRALIEDGIAHRNREFSNKSELDVSRPVSVSRLTQTFVEEAEFPFDALQDAYNLVALYSLGCRHSDNWPALARGPYGLDIRKEAWSLFNDLDLASRYSLRNSVSLLEAHAQPESFWLDDTSPSVVLGRLRNSDLDVAAQAAALVCGSLWLFRSDSILLSEQIYNELCRLSLNDSPALFEIATWGIGFSRYLAREGNKDPLPFPSHDVLDNFVRQYFRNVGNNYESVVNFAIETVSQIPRDSWSIQLSPEEAGILKNEMDNYSDTKIHGTAMMVIGYFARTDISDEYMEESLERVIEEGYSSYLSHMEPLFSAFSITRRPKAGGKRRGRRSKSA